MAVQTSEAVILRRFSFRSSSLIVHCYTRDFGKIAALAKGIKKDVTRYGSLLEPFSLHRVQFYERPKSSLYLLSGAELLEFYANIRRDLLRITYASYLSELVDAATVPLQSDAEIFSLFTEALSMLNTEASPRRVARVFEIKLLHRIGFAPNLHTCTSCGAVLNGSRAFSTARGGLLCPACSKKERPSREITQGTLSTISRMQEEPWERLARLKVTRQVGEELEGILRNFIDYHIGVRLKSISFLKSIQP